MRRRDGDGDAGLSDLDPSHAVGDRDPAELVAARQLARDPGHLLLGHALVGLVLEMGNGAAAGPDASGADEGGDRARALVGDLGHHCGEIDGLLGQQEIAAGDGRDERELVAVGELTISGHVLLVEGVEDARRLDAERGQS
jgi:hypothetical protein